MSKPCSLAEIAASNAEVARILENVHILNGDAARKIGLLGHSTSERSVYRYRHTAGTQSVEDVPKGWENFAEEFGKIGKAGIRLPTPGATENDLLIGAGFDPNCWKIKGSVNTRRWMRYDQEWLYYYKFDVEQGESQASKETHVEDLVKMIRKRGLNFAAITPARGGTYVHVVSDWQIGKAENGKGSADTVARYKDCLAQTVKRIKDLRKTGVLIDRLAILSVGDLVEGCGDHYCVAAETPILTSDMRWVPAGKLSEGDGLYAFDEEGVGPRGRRYQYATVLANKVELMNAVRVTFEDGSELVCTPNHPLLTSGSSSSGKQKKATWADAKTLVVGTRVARLAPWETGDTRDHGWVREPYMQSDWVRVTSVEDVTQTPMARLGTSSHTYFANGFASHNSMQTFSTDLDRRNQNRVVRELLTLTLLTLSPLFKGTEVAVVGGNHGENRKEGKSFTTFADNDDVGAPEAVKEAFDLAGWNDVTWHIPNEELSMCVDLGGVKVGIVHGHQFKGGVNALKKAEDWWRSHVFGLEPVNDAQILLSGHFHHFCAVNVTAGRTWLQAPTIDPGSKWYTDSTGITAVPGVLSFVVTPDSPVGYDHLRVLIPSDSVLTS